MITPENIFEVHDNTMKLVYENDYYINIFEYVKGKDYPELDTPRDIINLWDDFWFALPDNKSIHRTPFYQICDIAECKYIPDFYTESAEIPKLYEN